jgi:hypothetical protein
MNSKIIIGISVTVSIMVLLIVVIILIIVKACQKPKTIQQFQDNYIKNYDDAVIKFNSGIYKIFKPPLINYRELYKLYFKGIPDKYGRDGNKILGVEPESDKAIYYLKLIIAQPNSTDEDVLNLAKIYHYGMHKFEPDLNMAEKIYNTVIKEPKSEKGDAEAKELLENIKKMKAYEWLNIPIDKPAQLMNDWEIPPRNNRNNTTTIPHVLHRNGFDRMAELFETDFITWEDYVTEIAEPNFLENGTGNEPGSQNVHDSQVLSTINSSIKKIQKSTRMIKNNTQTMAELSQFIGSKPNTDKKIDAIRSIESLKDEKLSSSDMSELELLTLVWNRIHEPINAEHVTDLKNNLFNELADIQEHGISVCSTGRFTRIIDTLNVVDPEVSIKPTYAINEEMMSRASKIREELILKQPKERQLNLQKGLDFDQETYDTKEKEIIKDTLHKEYVVDNKILTETKFESEVMKWLNYI